MHVIKIFNFPHFTTCFIFSSIQNAFLIDKCVVSCVIVNRIAVTYTIEQRDFRQVQDDRDGKSSKYGPNFPRGNHWLPRSPAFYWRYIASGRHEVSCEPGPAGVLGRPGAERPTRRPSVVWNAAGRGEGRRRWQVTDRYLPPSPYIRVPIT